MRTIIAGSRSKRMSDVTAAMKACPWADEISEVVCGMAAGADHCGAAWAAENEIPVKPFPAKWQQYGRGAGFIRNAEMADYASAVILVWDGASRGSANMLACAQRSGLRIFQHNGVRKL